jgi:anti-anti-sigma regulatory factor
MRARLTASRTGSRFAVSGAIAPADIGRLKERLIESISGTGDNWTLDVAKVETSDIQLLQLLISAVATSKALGKHVTVVVRPGCPVIALAQSTGLLVALALDDASGETEASR